MMAQDDSQKDDSKTPPKASSGKRVILIVLVVMVLLGAGLYLFFTRNEVSTDDAYTTGRKISIAPHVSGFVEKLLVDDNQYVHKGDLLVQIDGRDYVAALHRAEASVQQAEADMNAYKLSLIVAQKNFPGRLVEAQGNLAAARAGLFKARTDYARQHKVARAATTQQEIDYAHAALDEATARVAQAQGQLTQAEPVQANIATADAHVTQALANLSAAQADLEKAKLNVEWMDIKAPRDGRISQRNVEQGNFVQTGQEMFSIVPDDVWVVANYKETQLTHMRPGQKVDIEVDAYPQLHLKGHVDSLQVGSGESFSAFPPQNATGNFVKTVQRIPVKILIDSGLNPKIPLALGLSVVPTVHTE
ncbi:HlyD family secretion protein [Aristophania vespae]